MGKKVRDGQCVSLVRDCVEACYGIPHTGGVEGAIDVWLTRHSNPNIKKYFDIVEGRPLPGDVIIFTPTATNKWGHIGMVTEDRGDGFNIVSQDGLAALFEEGQPGGRQGVIGMKFEFWTWTRYAGALRPKGSPFGI
jgi:hypothetical protein